MRTLKLLLLLATAAALFSFRPGNSCDAYFPLKPGTKWEQTTYDAKDKMLSTVKGELLSVSDIPNGLEATMSVESFDSKEKSMNKGEMSMKCDGDKFYMDMSKLFQTGPIQGMEGMDIKMEMTNEYMDFPTHPVAGQTLPDVTSTMTMTMNGVAMMTTTITMTNRKVEGFESVTTPAGTFDCVKFSYNTESKSKMMDMKSSTMMWMCKNTGMVKMENYDDKGKLESKNILTAFSE